MTKIKTQDDVAIGDKVSYQVAGMEKPEHGWVTGKPRLKHGLFVRYFGDERGKFTDIDTLRKGHLRSWWHRVPDPRTGEMTSWECSE